jgi:hypothetical protein
MFKSIAAAVTVTASVLAAPLAYADDEGPDPHFPDGAAGYCPGGYSTYDSPGSCMGVPYPDGTRSITSFSNNPTNPFPMPYWHVWCSADRNLGYANSPERTYVTMQGCGRGQ